MGLGIQGHAARALAVLAAASLLAALAMDGCSRRPASEKPPEPGDTAAATVDGATIWSSDVRREAAVQGLIAPGQALAPTTALFHRALDELIDRKVLADAATTRGLADDPAVRWRLEAARERALSDMLVEKAVAQEVNEKAIRGLYEQQLKLVKPVEEFHARQIVVAAQPDAVGIKALLANGAAFESLAQQRSTDAATRFNGGDLGYFTLDVMPQAYADALKPAKPGDVVGPFQTDAGWVVLKLEDRRPQAPVSLDEARPQIIRFLTYDTVRDLLEKQRDQAQIKVLVPPATPSADDDQEPASAPPPSAESSLAESTLEGGPPSGLRPAVPIASPSDRKHP